MVSSRNVAVEQLNLSKGGGMKHTITALALLSGIALGAMAMQALQAQAKPHAFFIADVAEVSNPTEFVKSARKTAPTIDAVGGKRVIQTQAFVAMSGKPPQRISVIEFENMDVAKAWANKPEVKALVAELDKYSKQRRFLVEGLK